MSAQVKLNIFVGFPSYGGNGGIAAEHPDIREWWVETVLKMKADPRIGDIHTKTLNDTPCPMVRNRFVRLAKEHNCDLLLMVDSDQSPNLHRGESWFRPFWDVAFEEIYSHYHRGPLVVGAPYGGPPNGSENVYVFRWDNRGDRGDETSMSLDQYSRHEASMMHGVQEAAALPTGLILYDMRLFDLVEPTAMTRGDALDAYKRGEISKAVAMSAMNEGYFYYEWKSRFADEKASTEDVQSTRDMSLAGMAVLGYNPVRCAWDSWIGHWKPWNVGRPKRYAVEDISATFVRAVEKSSSRNESIVDLSTLWKPYLEQRHGNSTSTSN